MSIEKDVFGGCTNLRVVSVPEDLDITGAGIHHTAKIIKRS